MNQQDSADRLVRPDREEYHRHSTQKLAALLDVSMTLAATLDAEHGSSRPPSMG